MKYLWRAIAVGALLMLPVASSAVYMPVNLHLPGYTYTALAEPSQYYVSDCALDPAGNL